MPADDERSAEERLRQGRLMLAAQERLILEEQKRLFEAGRMVKATREDENRSDADVGRALESAERAIALSIMWLEQLRMTIGEGGDEIHSDE